MDHVIYLDAKVKELELLLAGEKTMIIQGATERVAGGWLSSRRRIKWC